MIITSFVGEKEKEYCAEDHDKPNRHRNLSVGSVHHVHLLVARVFILLNLNNLIGRTNQQFKYIV